MFAEIRFKGLETTDTILANAVKSKKNVRAVA
jgi:hypothetical protein